MNYICKSCNYTTKIKCNYDKHLLTNKHINNINNEIINLYCNKCEKQLSSKLRYNNHLLSCRCVPSVLECSKCNKIFNKSISRYKHEQKCINIKKLYYINTIITPITNKNEIINNKDKNEIIIPINNNEDNKNKNEITTPIINNEDNKNEITIPIINNEEKILIDKKFLEEKDKRIKLLENKYLKKHKREQYPDSNVVYIITTEDNKEKRIYIIGKAKNLTDRLTGYNKTAEHEVIYYKKCKNINNMNIAERVILNKLDNYRIVANRDRFILPIDKDITFFTNIIDESVLFI